MRPFLSHANGIVLEGVPCLAHVSLQFYESLSVLGKSYSPKIWVFLCFLFAGAP